MTTVLVLTHSRDGINTNVVIDGITTAGHKAMRFDVDRVTRGECLLTIPYGSTHDSAVTLKSADDILVLDAADSIWFRRPYTFDFQIDDPTQATVAEEEVRDILGGCWELLSDKFWLSSPHAIARARLKPFQLAEAKRVGLKVAESLITNDPIEAERFSRQAPTVFKPISGDHLDYDDKTYVALTTLLTEEHIESLHLVRAQPVLLQRWIDKAFEVRVTYVGGKLFPCRISGHDFGAVVDWREPCDFEKLTYAPINLPRETEAATLELLEQLNLQYAAVDFAVDSGGEYYFLEVNPVGQWLWIEHETGMPISRAISDLLINRGGGDKL